MRNYPVDQIIVPVRQRRTMSDVKLRELRNSIQANGLFNAIVVRLDEHDRPVLVAGERRLRAVTLLANEEIRITHDSQTVPLGFIPTTMMSDLDTISQKEIELEENLRRENLSWQDECQAIADITALRRKSHPGESRTAFAKHLSETGGLGNANDPITIRTNIAKAEIVARHLDDPTIAQARTREEAYSLVVKKGEEAVLAELNRRQAALSPEARDIDLRQGDAFDILPQLDAGQFQLILTDPPYGIDVGQPGYRRRTVHHHNYDDSPDAARAAIELLFREGFRVCATVANIFIFLHIDNFVWAKEVASRMGWDPYPTPLTWQKSMSEGHAPWRSAGPRRVAEWILYARKGKRGLYSSPVDVFPIPRVRRGDRVYGAQKPTELLRDLITISTVVGDKVLDPFMGSGSTIRAARELRRKAIGIDISPEALNIATTFVYKSESEVEEGPDEPELPFDDGEDQSS